MKSAIKIGRDNSNDVIINEPRVGRSHAIVTDLGDGTYEVKDLNSSNGTYVNGQKITQQLIKPGDKLQVATSLVDWLSAFENGLRDYSDSVITEEEFAKIVKTITVGTSPDNDLVVPGNFVSKHHAKISVLKNGNYYLQDIGSSNGSFVNGAKVLAKNFSKTDVVKIGNADLPVNWFRNKKLQRHFLKDNKKKILALLTIIILAGVSTLAYFNRCEWFDIDCILSEKQIYAANKNSLVHIKHEYFYTISFNGAKYYIGKNKSFIQQTEANTGKENIMPYAKVAGNGCFVKSDGTILTSPLITSPWLNNAEQLKMLQEVIDSKTIKGLTKTSQVDICGETADLKSIQNGVVNNGQNYIQATVINECRLIDSSTVIIQSIKKSLPPNATVAAYFFKDNAVEKMHNSSEKYYSYLLIPNANESIADTFYMAKDTFNINKVSIMPMPHLLSKAGEGSAVFNDRGELIGIIQQEQVVLLNRLIKQINK